MPRSNKKKKTFHNEVPGPDKNVAALLNKEKFVMISRAIVSIIFLYWKLIQFIIFTGKCQETWNCSATWNNKPWRW